MRGEPGGGGPPERTLRGLKGLGLWLEVWVAECAGALQGLGVLARAEYAGSADPGWACGVGLKFPITSDGSGVPKEASETQVQANLPSLFPIPPLVSLGS